MSERMCCGYAQMDCQWQQFPGCLFQWWVNHLHVQYGKHTTTEFGVLTIHVWFVSMNEIAPVWMCGVLFLASQWLNSRQLIQFRLHGYISII
jgi:hypothetical protein